MMHFYRVLAQQVEAWRSTGHPPPDHSGTREILEFAAKPEGAGFRLRLPQAGALETYWCLRLVAGMPHILDLYQSLFSKTTGLLVALALTHESIRSYGLDNSKAALFERIKADNELVRQFKLEALRESLRLSYPSYFLALAMGVAQMHRRIALNI